MTLPSPSLSTSPRAEQWLRLTDDGLFELRTGKVELGQGISAALTQIACDTLGVLPSQVRWVAGDTHTSPDEGYTAGSQSIEVGGAAWRRVGNVVRSHFAQAAAQHWSCHTDELHLHAGQFVSPTGERLSYHALAQAQKNAWHDLRVDGEPHTNITGITV